MKTFISFSGGVESTTMCILYGKGATAIWCDTGWEHKEMYKRMDKVEQKLKEIHEGDFTLLRIKPSVYVKGRRVRKLQSYIVRQKFMPSKMARYCTKYFKIIPIDNFLKQQGQCELLIGMNADEQPGADRTGNFMKCKNVQYRYPLHEDGKTREDCEDILHEYGLHPEFPIYMQRGGCEGCIFKQEAEYKALYFFDRKTFEKNRTLEESVQDKRKKFFTISMTGKSFREIAEECETEVRNWGLQTVLNMYKKIKPSQSCGAFCHR
jgi:hypothetical protein